MFDSIKRLFSNKNNKATELTPHSAFSHPSKRVYLPIVKSWLAYATYQVGPYLCIFFTDCENHPDTQIKYVHAMVAYKLNGDSSTPCYATACETNEHIKAMKERGEPVEASYTFGIFPCDENEPKHMSMGWSDEWAKRDIFTATSLEVFRKRFMPKSNPVEVPVPERLRQRVDLFP